MKLQLLSSRGFLLRYKCTAQFIIHFSLKKQVSEINKISSNQQSHWQSQCELIHKSGNYSCREATQLPNGVRASRASPLPLLENKLYNGLLRGFTWWIVRLAFASLLLRGGCAVLFNTHKPTHIAIYNGICKASQMVQMGGSRAPLDGVLPQPSRQANLQHTSCSN